MRKTKDEGLSKIVGVWNFWGSERCVGSSLVCCVGMGVKYVGRSCLMSVVLVVGCRMSVGDLVQQVVDLQQDPESLLWDQDHDFGFQMLGAEFEDEGNLFHLVVWS